MGGHRRGEKKHNGVNKATISFCSLGGSMFISELLLTIVHGHPVDDSDDESRSQG